MLFRILQDIFERLLICTNKANFNNIQGKQLDHMQVLYRQAKLFFAFWKKKSKLSAKACDYYEIDHTLLFYVSTTLMFNKLAYVQKCCLEFCKIFLSAYSDLPAKAIFNNIQGKQLDDMEVLYRKAKLFFAL